MGVVSVTRIVLHILILDFLDTLVISYARISHQVLLIYKRSETLDMTVVPNVILLYYII